MHDQLQETAKLDSAWFLLHPRTAFRFRPASDEECRVAGVQDPDAVAIVVQTCGGNFLIVASGGAKPDGGAVQRLVETLGLPSEMGAQLASHLLCVRPDTLARAAARLMRSEPRCPGCHCGVRWTVLLAGLAMETASSDSVGLAELNAEWLSFKQRDGVKPVLHISDPSVVAASAAIREIGRSAS